jgi:hypothetical protein
VIPIGTQLEPRNPSDHPAVRVAGIEGDHYNLAPVEFGRCPVFAMDFDQIASAYICDGHKLAIEHESEADQWRKLSAEVYAGHLQVARQNEKTAAALPTPEEVFAQVAAAEAAESKPRRRGR